jgi:hypothetical protein
MVLICPRCRRANPGEATYCHFDGFVLEQPAPPPPAVLAPPPPAEFVFPSGRRCRSLEEVARGCIEEWEAARTLLRGGDFVRYFQDLNRHDLARVAAEDAAQSDIDVALHHFVRSLPAPPGDGPRLDLEPRRLAVTGVRAGERRGVAVTLVNHGAGQLQGKISVTEGGSWLKLLGGRTEHELAVRAGRRQAAALSLDARGLIAGQSYSGKLTAVTNGGIAELPVRLEVAAAPFPLPPYQGAASPRELAQRIRANPRPAAALLEGGEVARWFAANSWTYPIEGPPARGVGAVQQLFESLGLSQPPPLTLSDREVRLYCAGLEPAGGQVTLSTPSKKWVYAQAECDAPWLRVILPSVSGPRQAVVAFEVDPTQTPGEGAHEAILRLLANGGQRLEVRVLVQVGMATPPPEPPPERAGWRY